MIDKFTHFRLGALKRARPVRQSVHKSVKMLKSKKILSWIRDFHPSSGRSIKFKGNGDSHAAYLSSVVILRCLIFRCFQRDCSLY